MSTMLKVNQCDDCIAALTNAPCNVRVDRVGPLSWYVVCSMTMLSGRLGVETVGLYALTAHNDKLSLGRSEQL